MMCNSLNLKRNAFGRIFFYSSGLYSTDPSEKKSVSVWLSEIYTDHCDHFFKLLLVSVSESEFRCPFKFNWISPFYTFVVKPVDALVRSMLFVTKTVVTQMEVKLNCIIYWRCVYSIEEGKTITIGNSIVPIQSMFQPTTQFIPTCSYSQ